MLKSGQKRPSTPNKTRSTIGPTELDHWRQGVRETVLTARPDGTLNFAIHGGSDIGEFTFVSEIVQNNVNYVSGTLNEEDVVLEIQGQKVAGYTQRDVVAWLNHCCRNGNPVVLKTILAGSITKDLRQFLNTRFQKGSLDHDLQNTIRDNLYLRTVPVTTRVPRDGEVNGVDYTFLTSEEFMALERSGNLLESGIYEGNHYGTPKPSKEPPVSPPQSCGSNLSTLGGVFPGAHPSSEGKRKRNRSNVEAMAQKNMEPEGLGPGNSICGRDGPNMSGEGMPGMGLPPSYFHAGDGQESLRSDLGPLPPNWEKAYTERGEIYFIDHNSGTSHWLDPRLSKFQKKSLEECLDDELPYGWEKIDDPHYGTYFIDHVNRRTQYENPVIQAKRAVHDIGVPGSSEMEDSNNYPQFKKPQNATIGRPNISNHSGGSSKRVNRLNMYLTCIPCLATDGKTVLPKVQAQQTFVKPRDNGGTATIHVHPLQNLSVYRPQQSVEKSPSLNQTIVPRFAQPSFPAYRYSNVPEPPFSPPSALSEPNLARPPHSYHHLHRASAPHNLSFFYPMNSEGHINGLANTKLMQHKSTTSDYERAFFTRNPAELRGERLQTTLVKSSRGLGFTIVGGDDSEEEFLQIKSVVPNGPAWLDGKLETGDVLVYVNETCVLGLTHHDMVTVFQSISPSETVTLEVCRGYPLPFDPDDPNTEVVTTVAVNAPGDAADYNFLDVCSEDLANTSVKSMPDLCSAEKPQNVPRPSSTDVLLSDADASKPEFLSICIVKGAMGFGFTIADSAYGQKVKKILDRQRCKNLMEGDILVDINTISVRNMCHGEVVQVLKDCARNQEATVTVQRGGPGSPGKNKLRKKETLYRSKTPTADLYSTRQKEVVPNRPKTPLVDTRNRSKTPTWSPDEEGKGEENGLAPYDGYKTAFPYPDPVSALGERLGATTLHSSHVDYNRSQSPANELDGEPSWNKPLPSHPHYDTYSENSPGVFDPNSPDPMNRSASADYLRHYEVQQPQYYNGYEPYGYVDSYGQHKDMNSYPQHHLQSGYHQEMQNSMQQSNSVYYSTDLGNKRKESTSFEHEQPHPSNVTRYPRDLRWVGLGPGVRVYPAGAGMEWVETMVTLVRQETGFGFRIVGGTEEGSQVSIGHIVPGGAADLDGRLCTGDEIVSVDNESVLSTSHHHVVQLMGKAAGSGRVALGIRRRIPTQDVTSYARPDIGYPYDVVVTRRESEGFGFVIISSVNKAGSTIGRIIEGSPAERCGQLHVGDRILAVNHMDILNLHHGDIVNLIKDSGYTVTLTIGPPLDDASSTASISQREEEGMGGEEEQYHAVELSRGTRGFGFSIRGGREFQNMPLFVLQIAENGPAASDNRLKVGDQIIEINGINTKNMTHAEAIEIIRNGGPSVRLLVRRGGKVPSPPDVGDETGMSPMNSNPTIRPGSSLAQPNGPVRHSSPCEPGPSYWDRFNQS